MPDKINPKYKKIIDKWFELKLAGAESPKVKAWQHFNKTNDHETARVGFYRMLQNDTVLNYLKKRQKETNEILETEFNVSRADRLKVLKELGIDGISEWQGVPIAVKPSDRINAIKVLNEMTGDNEKQDEKPPAEINIYLDSYQSAREYVKNQSESKKENTD